MIKISIITVVKNAEKTLEQTISSVITQKYGNIEYIIVDGGSTDGTLDIIRKYEDKISRWISEPDQGISDAFNKGIRLASGDIIGIVSADDYLPPGALAKVAQTYKENPTADVIYGNAIFVEPYNQVQHIIRPDVGLRTIWRRQPLKHAATFVTRKAYERFGTFDLSYKLSMDYELILRFYTQGAKFVYTDAALAAFRTGGVSTRLYGRTIKEVRDISIRYGYSLVKANMIYWQKIVKLKVRYSIINLGGVFILNIYRRYSRRFSVHNEV